MLDPQPAEAAFYAVENFRSKLGMVDATVRQRFKSFSEKDDILAQWSRLYDKARKLSLKRNRLAHWNVIGGQGAQKLIPAYRSPAGDEYMRGNKRGLTLNDLRHLGLAFSLLGEKSGEVAKLMGSHPELHGRFAKLVARQMDSARRHQNQTAIERLELALSSIE